MQFISGADVLDKKTSSVTGTRVEVSLKPLSLSVPTCMAGGQLRVVSPSNAYQQSTKSASSLPVNNLRTTTESPTSNVGQSVTTGHNSNPASPVVGNCGDTNNKMPVAVVTSPVSAPANNNATVSPTLLPVKRPLNFQPSPVKNGIDSSPSKMVKLETRIIKKDGHPALKLHIRKEDLLRGKPKKHKHHHHHKDKHRDHHHHHRHHHKPKTVAADEVNNEDQPTTNDNSGKEPLQTNTSEADVKNNESCRLTAAPAIQSPIKNGEAKRTLVSTHTQTVTRTQLTSSASGAAEDAADHLIKSSRTNKESDSEFDKLIHIEKQANGDASVVHVYSDEIAHLNGEKLDRFVKQFFAIVYGESTPGVADHVMGIVHEGAAYMPDLIEYFAAKHPSTVVKMQPLGKSDIVTTSMLDYQKEMLDTYCNGTFRSGPLLQLSVVGTVKEEVGDFYPEFLDLLESNPFLHHSMPWGHISAVDMETRRHSNDGPILWVRPGEQMVPPADLPKSPAKSKRR